MRDGLRQTEKVAMGNLSHIAGTERPQSENRHQAKIIGLKSAAFTLLNWFLFGRIQEVEGTN